MQQKRNPTTINPLRESESRSQAMPTFVLEIGILEDQASLNTMVDAYLTGTRADKERPSYLST